MREEYDKIKEHHDINDFILMYFLQLDTHIFQSFFTKINLSNLHSFKHSFVLFSEAKG